MRRNLMLLAAGLLCVALAGPASAGSADDPEITDDCGDLPIHGLTHGAPLTPWHDVAAAWLDAPADQGTLVVTLQLCGDVAAPVTDPPVDSYLEVRWRRGECTQTVELFRPDRGRFQDTCSGQLVTVATTVTGNTVTWSVPHPVSGITPGDVLSSARATTWQHVRPTTAIPMDQTSAGRAYQVPVDENSAS